MKWGKKILAHFKYVVKRDSLLFIQFQMFLKRKKKVFNFINIFFWLTKYDMLKKTKDK